MAPIVGTLAFSHYSNEAVLSPRTVAQTGRRFDKPDGLWVSIDGEDDWASWCRSENYADIDAQYRHRVRLADDARILTLTSVEALDDFTERYGEAWPGMYRDKMSRINWHEVAATWQGIVIAPYQWRRRLALTWYYGWDCASGCIWDARAIASVDPA